MITSTVGYKTALEDIITLTDIKSASDFRQTSSSTPNDTRKGRHVDFYFEVPTSTSGRDEVYRSLPLSTTISGSASLTQNTALNDHRIIRGECEVAYWIEAQFRLAGKQVGFLNHDVKVSSLYPRLRASVSKGYPLTLSAKPDILARCRFQKSPNLCLTLSEADMKVARDSKTGKRHISFPLAVAMDTAGSSSIDSRQSFNCSVEAKWEVSNRFTITPVLSSTTRLKPGDAVFKRTTASTPKSTILFRPLPSYDSEVPGSRGVSSNSSYVATSQLDLPLPETVAQPSLNWKYLSRSYTLDLTLNFHGLQGAPKYSLHANIPISVFTYGSKADDAQKDDVVVQVSEAVSESDVDDEDNAEDLLAPLGRLQIQADAQNQRVATRTPPPPYFR